MPVNNYRGEQYSTWVGLIYVFNLIVGTGALTLPSVFAKAGWLLSTIILIFLALISLITTTFVVEAMSCGNAILQWKRNLTVQSDESEAAESTDSDRDLNATEETPVLDLRNRCYSLNRQIELGELASMFFSKVGLAIFYVSLCIYLYGDLSIYMAAIGKTLCDFVCGVNEEEDFATAACQRFGTDKMSVYRVFVCCFLLVIGPFSYFNVQKTKYLQMATLVLRWCAFGLMIAYAAVRLVRHGAEGHPPAANFTGVPPLIGAAVYSFMCHHSLPGLIAPLANKKRLTGDMSVNYAVICVFYALLAVTGIFAFKDVDDLYTLNFVPDSPSGSGLLATVVGYYLGLFPVFTLSTSFPIMAITLQNNLKNLFLDTDNLERYNVFLRRILFPTVAVVPPACIAIASHNLHSLVEFTGIFAGSGIQYVIPAMLVYFARRHCATVFGHRTENKHASPFRGSVYVVLVVVWAGIAVVLATVNYFS